MSDISKSFTAIAVAAVIIGFFWMMVEISRAEYAAKIELAKIECQSR